MSTESLQTQFLKTGLSKELTTDQIAQGVVEETIATINVQQ